ncbi:MAG: MBL fold metallo-hydrolase [Streptosporangiales bacterium]|nr:MBL fold metallo-hydrolase [Streptosporangiales bacterium]
MEVVELRRELHLVTLSFGQVYLWHDDGGLTLIDAGPAAAAGEIADAIAEIGLEKTDLKRVVLTHHHEDHVGSAAEISTWGQVTVMAHMHDAPVIRGDLSAPPPNLTHAPEWERDIWDAKPDLPPAPPVRVDRELYDGDVLNFGGGARVISVPGHTEGSIALHLRAARVLFTGDAAANVDGKPLPGVFNVNRARTLSSFRRLAELDVETACFGHGDPILEAAGTALRETAATL